MNKLELIKVLQDFPGNPSIVLWNAEESVDEDVISVLAAEVYGSTDKVICLNSGPNTVPRTLDDETTDLLWEERP